MTVQSCIQGSWKAEHMLLTQSDWWTNSLGGTCLTIAHQTTHTRKRLTVDCEPFWAGYARKHSIFVNSNPQKKMKLPFWIMLAKVYTCWGPIIVNRMSTCLHLSRTFWHFILSDNNSSRKTQMCGYVDAILTIPRKKFCPAARALCSKKSVRLWKILRFRYLKEDTMRF